MGGIVYYANYLKFIERARSTWVAELGVDQLAMKEDGVVFVVKRVVADYHRAAVLGDSLIVDTTSLHQTPARWVLGQNVIRNGELLFSAEVTIVTMTGQGRPTRLPTKLKELINSAIQ